MVFIMAATAQSDSHFLENVVERLMECSSGGGICASFVPRHINGGHGGRPRGHRVLNSDSCSATDLLDDYKTGPKSKILYESVNLWYKKF